MSRADFPHHRRRSTRLKGYDYTRAGAYFITICTYDRMQLFGHVVDGKIVLNACGEIVRDEWFRTARVRSNVLLFDHEFIIMPNHIHGIIRIMDTETHVGATRRVAPTERLPRGPAPGSLGAIIGQFKSAVTRRINILRGASGLPVWQRNYYEHIIRNRHTLDTIRQYIIENPIRWNEDQYHPNAPKSTKGSPLQDK